MPNRAMLSDDNRRSLRFLGTASAVLLAMGLFLAPERAWSNLFVATFYLLTIGLGGTVFLALTFVTGAGWPVAFRRVPEAMAVGVPITGGAVVAVLAWGMRQYGWPVHEGDAGTFWFKQLWLTPSFWLLRAGGYVAAWSFLGGLLVHRSRKSDRGTSQPGFLTGNVRLSALFLVVYAVTFSLASVDWVMALEPMWFSTMWGVYHFAGMILSALAVIVLLCLALSRPGRPLSGTFRAEHLHDLGKLMLGFSCFWIYIWFSQYMLIWYSNIPEETSYFILRTHGPWGPLVVVSIVLNWLVPFFVLLPRAAKRSRSVMLRVAVVILVGRWVDLYVMVFPPTLGQAPLFGLWEIAAIGCAAAAGIALIDKSFQAANPVPQHDPYLHESLHYHT